MIVSQWKDATPSGPRHICRLCGRMMRHIGTLRCVLYADVRETPVYICLRCDRATEEDELVRV